jgi:curved DNA-binding protein CbpA
MSLFVNDYVKYDLYQVFLLTKSNFSISSLRKAYQRQVLIYHPDKFPADMSETEHKEKMDIFLLINNGYTILANDQQRAEYDEKRENFLNEEKGFDSLKSQFNADKSKYTLSKEELAIKKHEAEAIFKRQMEEMNQELEKQSLSSHVNELSDKIAPVLNSDTNAIQLLVSEKVTKIESENFNNELSNITQNRNLKIDNDGTVDYDKLSNLGTVNGATEKYAFINEAFK